MPAYDKLIATDGQPRFGRFDTPVAEINYRDFHYTDPMDRRANALARHFHYKQFQFIGVTGERYILGCAVVSLKYVSNAFVYLFDRQQGQVVQKSLLQPLSLNCNMSNQPDNGIHRFRKGDSSFTFYAHSQPRSRSVEIFSGNDIRIDLTLSEPPGFQPLSVCTRTGFNGWTYTQKANALDIRGHIHWGERDIEITSPEYVGSYDWSCGYMRRHTAWNWASVGGTLPNGSHIGANLANGVNETGFNENGFWLDGILHPVGPVNFVFDKQDRTRPWRIVSEDKRVDLIFTPEGERREKLDVLVLASNFTQLAGHFQGCFTTTTGERIALENIPGFCEDHYAKW